jgi:ATP-binding cassette subfamily B protein
VGVIDGKMTLGDLVLVNAFMIQLYIPLNFLGVIYREIKQSLADMEKLFSLLDQNKEIADAPDAQPLVTHGAQVRFNHVDFSYDPSARSCSMWTSPSRRHHHGGGGPQRLRQVDLVAPAVPLLRGERAASPSTARTCALTQDSVRHAIGIVPQDTVLFNDTIEYNIAYGKPGATHERSWRSARRIDPRFHRQPAGWLPPWSVSAA